MPQRPIARVGDSGSHGGSIISGSHKVKANNRSVAFIGDIYSCPIHGDNPIITGAQCVLERGRFVAIFGSQTACGATITEGSPDVFVCCNSIGYIQNSNFLDNNLSSLYSAAFQIINEDNGEYIVNMLYAILINDCLVASGRTDNNGTTSRIYTQKEESIDLFIGTSAYEIIQEKHENGK